jgi:hypothetical protein
VLLLFHHYNYRGNIVWVWYMSSILDEFIICEGLYSLYESSLLVLSAFPSNHLQSHQPQL